MSGNGRRLSAAEREPMVARARELRAQGWTYKQLAQEFGVAPRTTELWTVGVVKGSTQDAESAPGEETGPADPISGPPPRQRYVAPRRRAREAGQ